MTKKTTKTTKAATANTAKSDSGSAFLWIFVVIALFVALGFAFSRGTKTSTAMITSEEAKAYATWIISYGNELAQTVRRLNLRGCEDTEISFENNIVAGYTNGTDTKCQVFHTEGGGLSWITPKDAVNGGTEWIFTTNVIPNVGDSGNSELVAVLQDVNLSICNAINEKLGFGDGTAPPQESDTIDTTQFTGTYGSTTMDDGTYFSGSHSGCFEGGGTPATGTYAYFQVLLPR